MPVNRMELLEVKENRENDHLEIRTHKCQKTRKKLTLIVCKQTEGGRL